ncbi:MAG: cytochrome c [Rhodothermales bacterium]|nr:cytochrome c [Rhodothermales bacterium]
MRLLSALLILPASVAAILWLAATQFGGSSVTSPQPDNGNDGQQIYMTRCVSCHQAEGRGISGYFPPLDGTQWVLEEEGRLIRIVLHGLTGPTTVQGVAYNGAMPAWGTVLSDSEIADVLSYIRNAWSNEAPEVKQADVAAVRALTVDRATPWTHAELELAENWSIPSTASESDDEDSSEDVN